MAKRRNSPDVTITARPTATRTGGTATMTATAPATVRATHDQIAKRAYEIWVAKGRPTGRDLENWNQAERELGLRR